MKVDISKLLGCRASLHIDSNDMQTPVICVALPRIGYFEIHYYGTHAEPIRTLFTTYDPEKDDGKAFLKDLFPLMFNGDETGQKKALRLRIMNVLYGQPEDDEIF